MIVSHPIYLPFRLAGSVMHFPSFVALFTLVLGVTAARIPVQASRYERYLSHTTTSRGYKYNFISIMPRIFSHKPTLLFLHGFPSHAEDWHNQIDYFKGQGEQLLRTQATATDVSCHLQATA